MKVTSWKNGTRISLLYWPTSWKKRGDFLPGQRKNRVLPLQEFFLTLLMVFAGVVGICFPFLLPLIDLVIPLPLALLVRLQSLRRGLFASAAFCLVLLLLPFPKVATLLLIGQVVPVGLVLGLLFKNHVPAGAGISISAFILAVFSLLGFLVATFGTGGNLSLKEQEEVKRAVEVAADLYARTGITESLPREEWEPAFTEAARAAIQLIPAQLVLWSITSAFLSWVILRRIFLRFTHYLPPFPPFSRWQFPWYISWGIIGGLGLTLAGDAFSSSQALAAGKNILFVSCFLYFVAGLSTGVYYLGKLQTHQAVKWFFVCAAIVYLPAATMFLVALGIMDSFFNFRFRTPKRNK
jgi:uncharacterized protein YybS (DUF2232 family)